MSRRDGGRAERRAEAYLRARGLRLLERNFQCRFGEIDLLMEEGPTVVIVEVRARRAGSPVTAAESVGSVKQARLLTTTRFLLGARPRLDGRPLRFDVVAICGPHGDNSITWIRDAFRP